MKKTKKTKKKAMLTNRTVGIKSGCFTLLHHGHIWMIEECRRHCDYLILLTNNDGYIERKKGVVPISLLNRKKLLKSIYLVDEVHSFSEETEDNWIKYFKKSIMPMKFPGCKLVVFHSIDTKGKKHVPGKELADKIVYIHKTIKISTTDIFNKIKEKGK